MMPTLTINFPADKQADIVAALRDHFKAPNATPQQLITLLETDVKTRVRNIYVNYMRQKSYEVSLD
jgi:hypothetical protein